MKFRLLLARVYLISGAIIFAPEVANASFGLSLDELYRQLIRDENQGQLPAYLSGAEEEKAARNRIDISVPASGENIIGVLESNAYETEEMRQAKERKEWLTTVLAVKKGTPTPFDISRIEKMADNSNPEAVELLAWLYATGTGVPKNLPKALSLYNEASRLGVAGAKANADTIAKSLSLSPRRRK